MKLAFAERAQADLRGLAPEKRPLVLDALLLLPKAIGRPHEHAGLGLRKLHPHVYEARVGLDLRLVFTFKEGDITVERVGSHDDVRRYLRSL